MKTRELFLTCVPDYRADPWGSTMALHFAVCDYLRAECPATRIPYEWGYQPGCGGPDTGSWEYRALDTLRPRPSDVLRLGWLCHRLARRLEARGLSY